MEDCEVRIANCEIQRNPEVGNSRFDFRNSEMRLSYLGKQRRPHIAYREQAKSQVETRFGVGMIVALTTTEKSFDSSLILKRGDSNCEAVSRNDQSRSRSTGRHVGTTARPVVSKTGFKSQRWGTEKDEGQQAWRTSGTR